LHVLIVLLDIPDDPGVWYSRAWAEGALKKLREDIEAQLPSGRAPLFEHASLADLSVPRANNVLFIRIISPREIRETDAYSATRSFLKLARLARLHAALARDPSTDLDCANESPVFLVRTQHKTDGQLFSFPPEVGLAARPSDGSPAWYAIAQKDISPESQTLSYAEAVAAWFEACPIGAREMTRLYVKHASENANLWRILRALFDLQVEPSESRAVVKFVLGVAKRTGFVRTSEAPLYYFTPSNPGDVMKSLEKAAEDKRAEALVCSDFKFTLKDNLPWAVVRSYPVSDCAVHLTYLRQTGARNRGSKRTFGLEG
jgi:hypothetical protein